MGTVGGTWIRTAGGSLPPDAEEFPLIFAINLHEVQDKKQRFWKLFEVADDSGEKFSNAELKKLILGKIPSETAATLLNKQSEEKVRTW